MGFDDFELTTRVAPSNKPTSKPTSLVLVSNQAIQVISPTDNIESRLPSVRETSSGAAAKDLYYLLFQPTATARSITLTFRAQARSSLIANTDITASLPDVSGNMISVVPADSPSGDAGLLSGYHLGGDTVYEDFLHTGPGSSDISEYSVAPPDGELRGPKSIEITERLTGGAKGLDFVWQTDSDVSPTLIAVSRNAEQSYAAYVLGSGIAFAVAAAALIALIQEGPDGSAQTSVDGFG